MRLARLWPAFALGLMIAAAAHAKERNMIFEAQAIPHAAQRYDTVGDWRLPSGQVSITVSRMADERYEFLVALHELVEAYLCKVRGVSESAVDEFDKAYEAARKPDDDSEPGDDPRAPYHREHVFASKVERMVADELGVDWEAYANAVETLSQ